jgi:uncharacterized protein with GYD domain
MPLYELRWMFKDATIKAMTDRPQDREPPARELIEGFGGRLHHYYFMLGEYDGLAIVEFPDNASAAATSMRASASGAFARFETYPLMTAQEAQRAMQMVKDSKVGYRVALLLNVGPGVLLDFGPPAVPQPTVSRVTRGAWSGLESQGGLVRATSPGA